MLTERIHEYLYQFPQEHQLNLAYHHPHAVPTATRIHLTGLVPASPVIGLRLVKQLKKRRKPLCLHLLNLIKLLSDLNQQLLL